MSISQKATFQQMKVVQSVNMMSERHKDRPTHRQRDGQTERQKSSVVKTKKFQNVNRMSERQTKWQTDRKSSSQNSRAAKEPALVLMHFLIMGEVLCILNSSIKKQPYEIDIQWIFTENIFPSDPGDQLLNTYLTRFQMIVFIIALRLRYIYNIP